MTEQASAADLFRSVQTINAAPTPAVDRPGTVKRQLAPETLRLYAGDWRHVHNHCAERGLTALPASPDLFAAFLTVSGTGRAALARRLAAIDHQHRQRGFPPPGAEPSVRAVLRRARRAAPRRTREPGPMRRRSRDWQTAAVATSAANATARCCCCWPPDLGVRRS